VTKDSLTPRQTVTKDLLAQSPRGNNEGFTHSPTGSDEGCSYSPTGSDDGFAYSLASRRWQRICYVCGSLPFRLHFFSFVCRSLPLRSAFVAGSIAVYCRFVCRSLRCWVPKRNEAALGRTGSLESWLSSTGITYMIFVVFVTHSLEYISLQNGLLYLLLRRRWVIEKMRCADRSWLSRQLHNQRKIVKFFVSQLFFFLVGRKRVHSLRPPTWLQKNRAKGLSERWMGDTKPMSSLRRHFATSSLLVLYFNKSGITWEGFFIWIEVKS